jgi:hypothetical protein
VWVTRSGVQVSFSAHNHAPAEEVDQLHGEEIGNVMESVQLEK